MMSSDMSAVGNEEESRDTNENLLSTHASSVEPKGEKRKVSWASITLDTWIIEGLLMVLSVACLISIYGILIAYNGRERPDFVYNITLNTIVSILSTGCKSSLVSVVGVGISQLKWLWFENRQQLSYLQTFEDASRGPLGSISLLFRQKARSIASLGAMVLILMLAFDPFVQQILSYPSESIIIANNTTTASSPQLRYIGTGISDTDWTGAHYLGVWSTGFGFTPSCPSGNCTWPTYKSVGICSQCSDMKSSATFDCGMPSYNDTRDEDHFFVAEGKCEVVLPQGRSSNTSVTIETLYLNDSFVGEILFTTHKVWEVKPLFQSPSSWNRTFSGIKNPLLVLAQASLGFDSDRITNISKPTEGIVFQSVTQCAFSYCIQDYNVSVTNGKPTIQKSSPDFGETYNYTTTDNETNICWRPSGTPSNTFLNYTHLGDSGLVMNATEFTFCGERAIETSPLVGSRTMSWALDSGATTWESDVEYGGLEDETSSNQNFARITELGIDVIVPRVAKSLTKVYLQGSNITNIRGNVYRNEVMVNVRWPWMILPTLLVILGVAFFAWTMYASRKKIFWKSSILALLFHGFDDQTDLNHVECLTGNSMEKLAEDIYVELKPSESDTRVMLRER